MPPPPPLEVVFVPLIRPDRKGEYEPQEFVVAAQPDGALDVTFTPKTADDLSVYLPTRGVFCFLEGGRTVTLMGGPSVTPASNAVAVQALNIDEMYRAQSEPVVNPASWWVVEGIDAAASRQVVVDQFDEGALAAQRGYPTSAAFLDALMVGSTMVHYFYRDAAGADVKQPVPIATLAGAVGAPVTARVAAYYGWDLPPIQYNALPASDALSSLTLVNPTLAPHPLVESARAATGTADLALYVSFQRWVPLETTAPYETGKGAFEPLPAGTVVKLMRVNKDHPDDDPEEVASGVLNDSHLVEFDPGGPAPFSIPREDLELEADEVLTFLVEFADPIVPQYQRDGTPRAVPTALQWRSGGNWLPIWMTLGFEAASGGQPGSLTGLSSLLASSLGLPLAPVVYNVGVPVFLQCLYARLRCAARVYRSSDERFPKGVKVVVRNAGQTELGEFRTDEHGQVWGTVTRWDPADTDIRLVVVYDMEDRPPADGFYPIRLPRVTGFVEDTAVPPNRVDSFDSSRIDQLAYPLQPFGFAGEFAAASLGQPDGNPNATSLQLLRVGATSVSVSPMGSTYTISATVGGAKLPLFGEHGGLIDAFKSIRHAHEWWSQLTSSVGDLIVNHGNPAEVQLKTPWADVFDALHRAAPAPPVLRVVVQPRPTADTRGSTTIVNDAGTDLFEITLSSVETWSEQMPVRGAPIAHDAMLPLLWRRETVHHEFAHLVFLAATELYGANAAAFAAALYNGNYDVFAIEATPFTVLLEGLTNTLTIATLGDLHGFTFARDAVTGAALVIHTPAALGVPALTMPINQGPATGRDLRLGLTVAGAFASALWEALSDGGVEAAPDVDVLDLRDEVLARSLLDRDVRTAFQRRLWLPMRALRTPDAGGLWDEVAGPTAFPTPFSFMQHLATDPDCLPAEGPDLPDLEDVFGTALAVSWHLWTF